MGVDGCGWVRTRALGPRAHSKHKNEVNGGIYGPIAHDLGAMAGEISPDMMFCAYIPK